jgi:hypothetical protein
MRADVSRVLFAVAWMTMEVIMRLETFGCLMIVVRSTHAQNAITALTPLEKLRLPFMNVHLVKLVLTVHAKTMTHAHLTRARMGLHATCYMTPPHSIVFALKGTRVFVARLKIFASTLNVMVECVWREKIKPIVIALESIVAHTVMKSLAPPTHARIMAHVKQWMLSPIIALVQMVSEEMNAKKKTLASNLNAKMEHPAWREKAMFTALARAFTVANTVMKNLAHPTHARTRAHAKPCLLSPMNAFVQTVSEEKTVKKLILATTLDAKMEHHAWREKAKLTALARAFTVANTVMKSLAHPTHARIMEYVLLLQRTLTTARVLKAIKDETASIKSHTRTAIGPNGFVPWTASSVNENVSRCLTMW